MFPWHAQGCQWLDRMSVIDAFPRVEDCCAELLHAPIMTHDGNSCQDVTTGNEDGWHPEWKLIFAELEVGEHFCCNSHAQLSSLVYSDRCEEQCHSYMDFHGLISQTQQWCLAWLIQLVRHLLCILGIVLLFLSLSGLLDLIATSHPWLWCINYSETDLNIDTKYENLIKFYMERCARPPPFRASLSTGLFRSALSRH